MAITEIDLVVTIDVEPLAAGGSSGPSDWDYGTKATLGAWQIVYDFFNEPAKVPNVYFVSPEALLVPGQITLYKTLQSKGAELGLHLHPQKWANSQGLGEEYYRDFGGLTAEQTRELLTQHIDMFEKAFGYKPTVFSSGTFSFNDHQFAILAELGIRATRNSLPGRVAAAKSAIWAGAELDIHYANRAFRHNKGDLDLVEMPLAVDTSELRTSKGVVHYLDLRPDAYWTDFDEMAVNILDQINERNPIVPVLNIVHHNDQMYWLADGEKDGNRNCATSFRKSLAAIQAACDAKGIKLNLASLSEVAAKYRYRAPPPSVTPAVLAHGMQRSE